MTNKEAIEFSKNMISQEGGRAIGASDFMLELCGYHVTALRMGIKALEQEPKTDVLNNIRAEIEEQKECRCFDDDDMYIYMTGLNDAIDIIDKYKAESEEV